MTRTMFLRRLAVGLSAGILIGASSTAFAETLTMWSRAAAAGPAQGMIDQWNSTHEDKIELTVIPDQQVVTKLATAVTIKAREGVNQVGWV